MPAVNMKTIGKVMVHLLAVLIFLAPMFAVSPAEAASNTLVARMTGAQEVPGPGAPFGRGTAYITLGQGEVCFRIRVQHITLPALAAHIHAAAAGVSGPVVIALKPAPDGHGASHGCVAADSHLIAAIAQNPGNYYVNVHTSDFPGGAVRGQLAKP